MVNVWSLSDLPVGKTAVVERILLGGAIRLRLLELGLVPGTRVRCVHSEMCIRDRRKGPFS